MIVVGGWPGRQVIGLNGHFGATPAQLTVGGSFENPLLNDLDSGDDSKELIAVVQSLPGSGVVVLDDYGGFEHSGAADGGYVTTAAVYSWAPGGPLTAHAPLEEIYSIFGTVAAAISGAGGVASEEAVDEPTVSTVGGSSGSIVGAGGIPSEEAVGSPTVTTSGGGSGGDIANISNAGGVVSEEAVGTPIITTRSAMTDEPVTVEEAKLAAKIDADIVELDLLIAGAIRTARESAEHLTGRVYKRRTFRFEREDWPAASERLAVYQPAECTISYFGEDRTWVALASEAYEFAAVKGGTELAPQLDSEWPTLGRKAVGARVRIDITAGPTSPDEVAESVKTYIKAHVSAWVKNPEALAAGAVAINPLFEGLLDGELLWLV